MFIILAAIIITFLTIFFSEDFRKMRMVERIAVTIPCAAFISVILLGFTVLLTCGIAQKTVGYRHTDPNDNIPIVSLSNGSTSEGSFVLGTGSVEGVEYYYYFQHNGEGYVRGKVKVGDSIIIEREENEPHIAVEKTVIDYDKHWWWTFGVINEERYHRIYVPHGTVVQQFSVR